MACIEEEIGAILRNKGLTLGTVESATGGMIASRIIDIAGSSDYFKGSVVSYANETKMKVVGVKKATLEKYGAVSEQVAEQMAVGGRKLLNVDICVSDTGIAGPGGATPGKEVGLFYLGLACQTGVFNRKHIFTGTRAQNRQAAAQAALEWVREYLAGI